MTKHRGEQVTHERVYIAFGGNVGDSKQIIEDAIQDIAHQLAPPEAISSLYRSRALTLRGSAGQHDYLNGVLSLEIDCSPRTLLTTLLHIEARFGRLREPAKRWQPRTLDLDIITFGEVILSSPTLTLPHSEYKKRDFVLLPLAEIAPQFRDPSTGEAISNLVQALESTQSVYILEKMAWSSSKREKEPPTKL